MKKIKFVFILFILAITIFCIICPPLDDEYCTIYPHISTSFNSLQFDPSAFDKIKMPDSYAAVTNKIGSPLRLITTADKEKIIYSHILGKGVLNDDVKYVGYYSTRSSLFSNTYKWHLFVIYFDKDYHVIGKKDNWLES